MIYRMNLYFFINGNHHLKKITCDYSEDDTFLHVLNRLFQLDIPIVQCLAKAWLIPYIDDQPLWVEQKESLLYLSITSDPMISESIGLLELLKIGEGPITRWFHGLPPQYLLLIYIPPFQQVTLFDTPGYLEASRTLRFTIDHQGISLLMQRGLHGTFCGKTRNPC
jgi:hypothetical protein